LIAGVVIIARGVVVVDAADAPVVCVICVIIEVGIVVVNAVAVVDVVSDSEVVAADCVITVVYWMLKSSCRNG